MTEGMGLTPKRVFARNQNLDSPTAMQEPLHKQGRGLNPPPPCFNTFLAGSTFMIMRDIVLCEPPSNQVS